MKKSRKLAWVVLGVVVGVSLALVVFLASPLWVWFAYESETILLVEFPVKMTGPNAAFRDDSKPTHERIARKKRFRWGPGGRFRVEEKLCYGCLQGEHGHTAFPGLRVRLEVDPGPSKRPRTQ